MNNNTEQNKQVTNKMIEGSGLSLETAIKAMNVMGREADETQKFFDRACLTDLLNIFHDVCYCAKGSTTVDVNWQMIIDRLEDCMGFGKSVDFEDLVEVNYDDPRFQSSGNFGDGPVTVRQYQNARTGLVVSGEQVHRAAVNHYGLAIPPRP